MNGRFKNELGNTYGDFIVEAYTELRVSGNGCVIWACRCKHCNTTSYYSGNSLRFEQAKHCQFCNDQRRKKNVR